MKKIPATILARKGARKAQAIPDDVLALLNSGAIETVNLTEWLAIDQITLIEQVFPRLGLGAIVATLTEKIQQQQKPSTMNTVKLVGEMVYAYSADNKAKQQIFTQLSQHGADTIRCYAPYLTALDTDLSCNDKLQHTLSLVADKHFGVREVVWMALRPAITTHLAEAIQLLSRWTTSPDENIRRFTSEATRPRGVWCKHIEALKQAPEQALPILAALKADKSKYVQDSVGNWLNDASKSQPDFVINLCAQWLQDSPCTETEKIVQRAQRTLEKKAT